ncbi:VOC family protein [Jannaschia sp. M317]|uniref:VOC family protein n=1 Tax=Jannaschia sp. M317 TaxID=2867011 RepID=UPI0021A26B30|nr:VOC family protein [Jannaschia sp. M317]UWQ18822.1 VOC family protein [Jannaschia sp. M317]
MQIDSIHHAGLSVSDFDAAVAWWGRHFGFALLAEWGDPALRMGLIGKGGIHLELFCKQGATPGPDEAQSVPESFGQRGWKHLAFAVPDLESSIESLRAAGVEIIVDPVRDAPPGYSYAFFRDPDGNQVELVELP